MNYERPRRGRRPGRPDTRAALLDVARRRFLAEGYNGVTLRSIADEAGVDVALISYFFGSKRGLFAACLALPANPPDVLRAVLPGDPLTLAERILTGLLATWDDPGRGPSLRSLVGAAVQDEESARLLREVLEHEIVDVIAGRIRGPRARQRAAAVSAQLAGVVFTRYVLALEPIASMPADELVRALAPGVRAVLLPPRPSKRTT